MANREHLRRLQDSSVDAWNLWRRTSKFTPIDLGEATLKDRDLRGADLRSCNMFKADLGGTLLAGANLSDTDLRNAKMAGGNLVGCNLRRARLGKADLSTADLSQANLSGASLTGARFPEAKLISAEMTACEVSEANFCRADLSGVKLRRANLVGSDLSHAVLVEAELIRAYLGSVNLSNADLSRAWLNRSVLVNTNLRGAKLNGCRVYGISAWDVDVEGAQQEDLIITPLRSPENPPSFEHGEMNDVTVDNLKIAQFVYLLLNNREIREVIDTITSKAVLILGRFTPERKAVLDALRTELRKRNYTPILFDFDGPANRDITETVATLAHMARFIVADITDAKSIPQELMLVVPTLPSVPVVPLLQDGADEYAMFSFFSRYPWVLPLCRYGCVDDMVGSIVEQVIVPAEEMARQKRHTG